MYILKYTSLYTLDAHNLNLVVNIFPSTSAFHWNPPPNRDVFLSPFPSQNNQITIALS